MLHPTEPRMQHLPNIPALSGAPLRNRIRLELNAPPAAVWALIGDFKRFPEYSAGLERVEPVLGSDGRCSAYVCYFKPMAEGEPGLVHREIVRWYDDGFGYASQAETNNAFGLRDDLNLVTVEPFPGGALLTWDVYFEAADVALNQSSYDSAFEDIARHLIARFGGQIRERFVRANAGATGAEAVVTRLSDAVNRGDLDAATALYASNAMLVAQPASVAKGRDQIREALRAFTQLRPTLSSSASKTIEADDLALYMGRWQLAGRGPDGAAVTMGGESTDVLHRSAGGTWLIALDNPWGTALVGGSSP
jgi:uncharacterized protein (TIGR02246 family)